MGRYGYIMDSWVRYPLELGVTIRRLREDRGLTQEQLAERMHVSRRWVGMLEAGRNPGAQFSMVNKAVKALGAELHILTREEHSDV
jgi:transcriptional regulator with XRE-family HTH domain